MAAPRQRAGSRTADCAPAVRHGSGQEEDKIRSPACAACTASECAERQRSIQGKQQCLLLPNPHQREVGKHHGQHPVVHNRALEARIAHVSASSQRNRVVCVARTSAKHRTSSRCSFKCASIVGAVPARQPSFSHARGAARRQPPSAAGPLPPTYRPVTRFPSALHATLAQPQGLLAEAFQLGSASAPLARPA